MIVQKIDLDQFPPGAELIRLVRAGFIIKGTSLQAWCEENNKNAGNARHALFGSWDGNKAKRLRAEIIKASGLADQKGKSA